MNGTLFVAADSGERYGQELYRLVSAPIIDVDEDGMPDAWETEHGLSITAKDFALDLDKDGIPNAAEYTAGTDPNDPISTFQVASTVRCI